MEGKILHALDNFINTKNYRAASKIAVKYIGSEFSSAYALNSIILPHLKHLNKKVFEKLAIYGYIKTNRDLTDISYAAAKQVLDSGNYGDFLINRRPIDTKLLSTVMGRHRFADLEEQSRLYFRLLPQELARIKRFEQQFNKYIVPDLHSSHLKTLDIVINYMAYMKSKKSWIKLPIKKMLLSSNTIISSAYFIFSLNNSLLDNDIKSINYNGMRSFNGITNYEILFDAFIITPLMWNVAIIGNYIYDVKIYKCSLIVMLYSVANGFEPVIAAIKKVPIVGKFRATVENPNYYFNIDVRQNNKNIYIGAEYKGEKIFSYILDTIESEFKECFNSDDYVAVCKKTIADNKIIHTNGVITLTASYLPYIDEDPIFIGATTADLTIKVGV